MSARYFAYDPEQYEETQFPQQDTAIKPASEHVILKAFMEVYRDTANALDGMHLEARDARQAKALSERALDQLDKMRAHCDDLNAKITKARELAAADSSDLAKQIIQVLADTKENEE